MKFSIKRKKDKNLPSLIYFVIPTFKGRKIKWETLSAIHI